MTQTIDSIPPTVRRRFILGRPGLWPGRRWAGKEGTARAIHEAEAVQLVRFANFLGAKHLDSSGINATFLRNVVGKEFPI